MSHHPTQSHVGATLVVALTPDGYRPKISRASRMSDLVDRITGLAALGGSAAFLEILRRWLQRRQAVRERSRRPVFLRTPVFLIL